MTNPKATPTPQAQAGDFRQAFDIPTTREQALACVAKQGDPLCMTHDPARMAAAAKLLSGFDFAAHLARQAAWSEQTFGPGARTAGVTDHIRKELAEIEADPADSQEWIDVVILGLDGAWRSGLTPEQIIAGIVAKQAKNEGRVWPDWRTADPNKAIEHDRSHDFPQAPARDAGAVAWQRRSFTPTYTGQWGEWDPRDRDEPFPATTGRWRHEYRELFTRPDALATDAGHNDRRLFRLAGALHDARKAGDWLWVEAVQESLMAIYDGRAAMQRQAGGDSA